MCLINRAGIIFKVSAFGDENYAEIRKMREDIFCSEQGSAAENVFDDKEDVSIYPYLCLDGEILACARIMPKNKDGSYHFDNLCVSKNLREKGLGGILLSEIISYLKQLGAERITVNAQTYAVGFYEKFGFVRISDEFILNSKKAVAMTTNDFSVFSKSKWVGNIISSPAFVLGKKFTAAKNKKYILRSSAMGFEEIYLNGIKVTDERLIPALSDYEKRDLSKVSYPIFDTMTHRIYYVEYDVTDLIADGENFIAVHVGAGWYGQTDAISEDMPVWGKIKAIFEIISDDNVVCFSDEDTMIKGSFVSYTGIYTEEKQNGRLFTDDFYLASSFDEKSKAKVFPNPVSLLQKQDFPGDSVQGTAGFKKISEKGRKKIYDLGAIYSGAAVIKFEKNSHSGDSAETVFGDTLDENGDVSTRHNGGINKRQTDFFIRSDDDEKEYSVIFTWRAGRYISVDGRAELVRFDKVCSPVKLTAEFKSENEILNWLFDAYQLTQSDNIHDMIPSDCPHRERLGYTGDGQLTSGACMTIFDSSEMYKKWMRDISDCQDIFDGHVQHTAPFWGGGGGPGGWGGAICIVPWNYYLHFGDKNILAEYYPRMKKYLSYMESRSENHIVTREEKDGWCLGDWCPLSGKAEIPEELVNTYYYAKCAEITADTAKILSDSNIDFNYPESRPIPDFAADSKKFSELFEEIKSSFISKFYDEKSHSFASGIQGADAFGLDLFPDFNETFENLAEKYEKRAEYDTGIFATPLLTKVLFDHGRGDIAYSLLTNKNQGSFYNMMSHGSKTLWEEWFGKNSLCHPMFGAVTEYLFTEILGIKQVDGSAGYEKIKIEPANIPALGTVSGSIETVRGKISVKTEYDGGKQKVSYCADKRISVQD